MPEKYLYAFFVLPCCYFIFVYGNLYKTELHVAMLPSLWVPYQQQQCMACVSNTIKAYIKVFNDIHYLSRVCVDKCVYMCDHWLCYG